MKQTVAEKITYITPKGLFKLQAELDHLKTVKRREIAAYLQETLGDIEEGEFLIAQEEQAFVEGRIRQLEGLLSDIRIIQPDQNHPGVIEVGSTVVLREENMDVETYQIVGATEADPGSGLISNESPLGRALIGSQAGDDLEINAPAGILKFRVIAVQ